MLQLISVAQQNRTTAQTLIKFAQLIPESYHDTVRQEAAEKPHGKYNQLIHKGVETRSLDQSNNQIPIFFYK